MGLLTTNQCSTIGILCYYTNVNANGQKKFCKWSDENKGFEWDVSNHMYRYEFVDRNNYKTIAV